MRTSLLLLAGLLIFARIPALAAEPPRAAPPQAPAPEKAADDKPAAEKSGAENAWKPLWDGKTLAGWEGVKKGVFEKGGKVEIRDGAIFLASGEPGTAIRSTAAAPKIPFEIRLEAQRAEGEDFFCGLTFPAAKGSLSLILGGWSGRVCGLSCIDGRYAIDNDTCCSLDFENGRWYRVRVEVRAEKVRCFVDDKELIVLETKPHKLEASEEMQPCLPLGIATWKSTGALRKIEIREISP